MPRIVCVRLPSWPIARFLRAQARRLSGALADLGIGDDAIDPARPFVLVAPGPGGARITALNHAAAAWIGAWVAGWFSPQALRWLLAASFLAVALWALKPDQVDEAETRRGAGHGAFVATLVAFFLAEIGDKTQVATVVLAAQYEPLWQVVAGTTIGMLLANAPVVALGARFAHRIPLRLARATAAAVFALLALWIVLRPAG